MACAHCISRIGREDVAKVPEDPVFPVQATRSAAQRQFEMPRICSFCGSVYCPPKHKLDVRVYQTGPGRGG